MAKKYIVVSRDDEYPNTACDKLADAVNELVNKHDYELLGGVSMTYAPALGFVASQALVREEKVK